MKKEIIVSVACLSCITTTKSYGVSTTTNECPVGITSNKSTKESISARSPLKIVDDRDKFRQKYIRTEAGE